MHIAKITHSGGTVTIQLPPGIDLAEGDMAVVQEGAELRLSPIPAVDPRAAILAWLDRASSEEDRESVREMQRHIDEMREQDRLLDRPPPEF